MIVRDAVQGIAVDAGHGAGGDERVDDRFLGRLDGRIEQRIDDGVATHWQASRGEGR